MTPHFWLRLRQRETLERPVRYRGATAAPVDQTSFGEAIVYLLRRLPWPQMGAALTIAILASLLPWLIGQGVSALDNPITRIQVSGNLHGIDRHALEQELKPFLGRSYFATDLGRVKSYVEAQPWVASVAVSRVWPDALAVDVVEQKPVAYWNGNALMNGHGEVFRPTNPQIAGNLPHLTGPQGRSADVLAMAQTLSHQLAAQGLTLAGLALEERGSWTLQLGNGIQVVLGKDPVNARFGRFLTVYRQELADRADQVQRIDARYANGVAVQWKSSGEGVAQHKG